MGRFPSGQREQTVNLPSQTSVVRIHPLPPARMAELADALVSGTSEDTFMQVQVLFLAPNKVDNFDTIGIETIDLILFVKMLMAQGFSVLWQIELVSLWVFRGVIISLLTPIMGLSNIHAETIPRRKVSL